MPRRARALAAAVAALASVALLVAPWASDAPDGLQRVAREHGFARAERSHALGDGPIAGYQVDGVEDERVGTGLASAAGVVATFATALAAFAALRAHGRRRPRDDAGP